MKNKFLPPLNLSTKLKEFFGRLGLVPYVCLNPFVKIPKEIPVDVYGNSIELQKEYFFYSKEIKNHLPWQTIAKELNFPSISYMNEVMMVGDNSLGKSHRFEYECLIKDAKELYSYLDRHNINQLSEGGFAAELQIEFLKSLRNAGYEKAIGSDEFDLEGEEFFLSEKINFLEDNRAYINYRTLTSLDLNVVFTVHWDCFFTVLATTEGMMPEILSKHSFEGFYPDEQTTFLL